MLKTGVQGIYDSILQTGRPIRFEAHFEAMDLWISAYAFPIDRPEFKRIAILFSDIGDIKRAEEALLESSRRKEYLLKLSDALRTLSDVQSIQDVALCLLVEHLRVSRASYSDFSGDYGVTRSENLSEATQNIIVTYEFKDFMASIDILRSGRDLVMHDVLVFSELSEEERARFVDLGIRANISVPIIKAGKLVAALSARQTTPREWQPDEVEIVRETAERDMGGGGARESRRGAA